MAIFDSGASLSIQQILDHPPIVRLLNILSTRIVCLSSGQIYELLREDNSSGISNHDFHKNVRSVLHELEVAGYLASDVVERLPPVTIGAAPLFRLDLMSAEDRRDEMAAEEGLSAEELEELHGPPSTAEEKAALVFGDEPLFRGYDPDEELGQDAERGAPGSGKRREGSFLTSEELLHFSEIAKHRLPTLEAHERKRFYFGTKQSTAHIRSLEPRHFEWPANFANYPSEEKARQLIEWHKNVEKGANPSPNEIAGTQLTAVFNLSQMILWERFRSLLAAERFRLDIYGRANETAFDGRLLAGEGIALVFLRPLLPHQMQGIMDAWRSMAPSAATLCWWL